ncbi:MAG: hypothetical protein J6K26_04255 [Lachnospiraceae bacterium]|nr:hypothetical protein [Lachnospiraceae bacterium]
MNKKILSLLLLFSLMVFPVAGCAMKEASGESGNERDEQETTEEEATEDETVQETESGQEAEQVDPAENIENVGLENSDDMQTLMPDAYLELIESYASMLAGEDIWIDGSTGVWELVNGDAADAAAHVGLTFEDMNQDGIPELIIGYQDGETDNIFCNQILAVYSYVDERAALILEGWARNRYYYLGNGEFLCSGSSGASSSCIEICAYEEERLVVRDFYFTEIMDDNYEEIGVYYNTTGEWDVASSELLPMSVDEFWQIEEEYETEIVNLKLIPLEKGQDYSEAYSAALSTVNVAWAEDVPYAEDMESFTADETEFAGSVVFFTYGRVRDFKILSLTLEEVAEDGTISFSTEEIYSRESLTKDSPLLVKLAFFGTIPSYGISYVDENGATRNYAIAESGKDGSVILWEF